MAAGLRNEKKRMYLWGVIIVAGLITLLLQRSRQGALPETPAVVESGPAVQQVSALVQAKRLAQKEKLKQPWGRSPFASSEADAPGLPADLPGGEEFENFSLTGIFSRQGRRIAIINHFLVREGDRVGEAEVLRIEARRVVLKKANDVMILKLEGA